jgi:hypothetical protein
MKLYISGYIRRRSFSEIGVIELLPLSSFLVTPTREPELQSQFFSFTSCPTNLKKEQTKKGLLGYQVQSQLGCGAKTATDGDETDMDEAQRQLEEKREYNRRVSARAREKTKQTIASLEATVVTLAKRVLELEQTRDLLFEQVRLIAEEKLKIEQALLRLIQDRQGTSLVRSVPPPQQAPALATNSDAQHALLTAVLRENNLGPALPYGTTNPPPTSGTPHAARHFSATAAGATSASQQQQQQRIDQAVVSLNALLRGENANASNSTSSTQKSAASQRYSPSVVAPPSPPPPPRGFQFGALSTQQPAGLIQCPPQRVEQELAILQLLQRMDRRTMEDRNNTSG